MAKPSSQGQVNVKTSVGWNEFLWSRELGRDSGGWNRSLSTWHRPKRQRQGRGSIILSYGVLEEKTSNVLDRNVFKRD